MFFHGEEIKACLMLMGMFQERKKLMMQKRGQIAGVMSLRKQERMRSSHKLKAGLGKAPRQFIYRSSNKSRMCGQSPGREEMLGSLLKFFPIICIFSV